MKFKVAASVIFALFSGVAIQPAWCDQWTSALTPTSAQAANYNGALSVYVTTTQAVVNPANCPATDGWVAIDPVFSKEALAMALTAIVAGHQVQIYVSSTQCAQNRPMILDFQVNW
jgi:hypothetical protein